MKRRFARNRRAPHRTTPVHRISLPTLDEADAVIPREGWGTARPVELSGLLPDHIDGEFILVPEGFVPIVRCRACGGRHEGLVDMRAVSGTDNTENAGEASASAIGSYIDNVWIPEHEDCTEEPRQHHVPQLVKALIGAAEATAREVIGTGQPLGTMYHLLDTRGNVYLHPVTEVSSPLGTTERVNEFAAVQFALRELVRARRIDLLAAAFVAELWMTDMVEGPDGRGDSLSGVICPSTRVPKREEGFLLGFVTPSHGEIGLGRIERRSGRLGQGPGRLGPIAWHTQSIQTRLLDTLLVTSDTPRRR